MSTLHSSKDAARKIWTSNSLPEAVLSHLAFKGDPDTAVNSSFRIGTAAQASIGLSGLSAAHFHSLRTGVDQDVAVDGRHAALSFHSEAWYIIDGKPGISKEGIWDNIAGLYKTKDDSYVRVHTNFPHHRRGILNILNIPDTPSTTRGMVAEAMLRWNAVDFETEAASRRMCATALRSFAEWDRHPQAQALVGEPPVTITKIGEAPRRVVGEEKYKRPLEGVRVLDLSRVLAGPVAGRALAAYGADVLFVTSPRLPALLLLDVETSLGKRTTQLNLEQPVDVDKLQELAKDTDVFLQAYRPGGLEERGFGPRVLATQHPGIICANLTAWGWDGPWKDRRGFDSLVQTATGFNVAEGEAYAVFQGTAVSNLVQPRVLPMQALDHAAGYLLAFGVNAALCKTITEGGSWEVRVSLAAVGQWVRSLGRLSSDAAFRDGRPLPVAQDNEEISRLSVAWHQTGRRGSSGRKTLTALKHAAILSETPVREGEVDGGEAPMALDAHDSLWFSAELGVRM